VTGWARTLLVLWVAMMAGCNGDAGRDRTTPPEERDPWLSRRLRMVEEDIAGRGVRDRLVLEAMRKVPRHEFVPAPYRAESYADHPLSIGHEQTISQPYIVAFMTEALGLEGGEKVLEIGTGSGYQAAVLAEVGAEVYTIEIIPELAEKAKETFHRLGYDGIHVRTGDGYRGWPEKAPFDAIIVTAAPGHVPEPLIEQLAVGGRMVIPVDDGIFWGQSLRLIERTADGVRQRKSAAVRFVPMTGEAQKR
jgi:protein-L-isoaspartate(D-aspartate) O-methyltransferase